MKKSVNDCSIVELPVIIDQNGSFTSVNNLIEIPFKVNRIFYLYDIARGASRGSHAHNECHQFLIAATGSFQIDLFDGKIKRRVELKRPNIGLYIPPGIWASEVNFSPSSVCLVLASHPFDESDYIRNISDFKKLVSNDM